MKNRILQLMAVIAFAGTIMAQEVGKITIRNRDESYPKFIVSINGVRSGIEYRSAVAFDFLDETKYKVKIYQDGSSQPLSFTIGNTLKYNSKYVINKDEFGNYAIAAEGKVPMVATENNELSGSTVPVNSGPSFNSNNPNLGNNAGNNTALSNTLSADPTFNPHVVTPPRTITVQPTSSVTIGVSTTANSNGAMDDDTYNGIVNTIRNEPTDNSKMSMAKTFITQSNLTATQVLGLVKLFSFESNRLSFSKWAYSKTMDKKNYFKVYDGLTFSSSKKDLSEYIKKNP